jgi:hypothetical protein
MDPYIHSPVRLHGVVLNLLSTGTTLKTLILSVALGFVRYATYIYTILIERKTLNL